MFILFGYKTKPTIEGVFKHKCQSCKKSTNHRMVKVTSWFTLFFIPIIPFSNKLFIECAACGMGGQVKHEFKDKMLEIIEKNKQKTALK